MTRENYTRVKEAVGKYVAGIQREPEPEQAIYKSYYYPQYVKRFDAKAPPAEAIKDDAPQLDDGDGSSPVRREANQGTGTVEKNMTRYQPL